MLGSAEEVLRLTPRATSGNWQIGVVGPHPEGFEAAIEVRAFFSQADGALREDPVTGSLNASLAQWLITSGRLAAPYVAAQGTVLERSGRVHVSSSEGDLWIGGSTRVTVTGSIDA